LPKPIQNYFGQQFALLLCFQKVAQ
jgi:hypothetical protein